MHIRQAGPGDISEVARIFVVAFPKSTARLLRPPFALKGPTDLFHFLLVAEPGAFRVIEVCGRVVGYIVAPSDLRQLQRMAVRCGWWWRWLRGAVTGQYRLRWLGVLPTVVDQLITRCYGEDPEYRGRILSIAVHPRWQKKGLGQKLLAAALAHLQQQGVKGVRLEMLVHNLSARALYRRAGFRVRGQLFNTQGRWVIMSRSLL